MPDATGSTHAHLSPCFGQAINLEAFYHAVGQNDVRVVNPNAVMTDAMCHVP